MAKPRAGSHATTHALLNLKDDPHELAAWIERALKLYPSEKGVKYEIIFYEGELRLIARALRNLEPKRSPKRKESRT